MVVRWPGNCHFWCTKRNRTLLIDIALSFIHGLTEKCLTVKYISSMNPNFGQMVEGQNEFSQASMAYLSPVTITLLVYFQTF